MSSLALMRWLERAPERYDAGMRLITLGRVEHLHAAVAAAAAPEPGGRVLEIGCGTGAVTERLVRRGAHVTALDQNPEMLERARVRLGREPGDRVDWQERTASEIDALPAGVYDAVVASLSLSEMSGSERRFVLRAALVRLRPGGVLAVTDEVCPRGQLQRLAVGLVRLPQAALGWLVAGSVSHPIPDLAGEMRGAGFEVTNETRALLGSFAVVLGVRPA
jgi:demethylmenaquinone methyltransferase/2-methoxy-6-polyprenyl-1,4-benzoquinol methylase